MPVFCFPFPRWPRLERLPFPDRAFERALSPRARSSLRRDPRRVSRAARDSIPHRNARRGAWISARLPRGRCAIRTGLLVRPFRAALYFWEIDFHFRNSSTRHASSAGLLFSSRHAGGAVRQCSRALADRIGGPDWVPHACGFSCVAQLAGFACETSGIYSRGCWMRPCGGSRAGTARAIAFRGPPPYSDCDLCLAFAIALSAAIRMRRNRGGHRARGRVAGHGCNHRDVSFFAAPRVQRLELTVLDVGQGDSLFLSFPHGRTMLVDGGGELGNFHSGGMRSGIDVGEDVVSPYLWSRGLETNRCGRAYACARGSSWRASGDF